MVLSVSGLVVLVQFADWASYRAVNRLGSRLVGLKKLLLLEMLV